MYNIHKKLLEQLSTLSFDNLNVCANFILTKEQLNKALDNKEIINTDLECQIDINNNIIKNNNILSRIPILPQINTNIYELVLKKLQKYKIIQITVWLSGENIYNKTTEINITYVDINGNYYHNRFSNYGYSPNYHYMPLTHDIYNSLILQASHDPKSEYKNLDRLFNHTIQNYYYPFGSNISMPISGEYFYIPINWYSELFVKPFIN